MNDINQTETDKTCDWLQSSSILPATEKTTDRATFNKSTSLSLSTSTALPTEILSNLDEKLCFTALEFVMTLLASQSLLALKDVNLSNRNKQLIKRELSTELHIFHDWLKKTLRTDLNKSPLHRKKYGAKLFETISCDRLTEKTVTEKQANTRGVPDLLLNRKQHLDIGKSTGFVAESTPIVGTSKSKPLTPLSIPIEQDVQTTSTVEQPIYTGLSMVKIVEEDYVHFLSNIFTLICQSD